MNRQTRLLAAIAMASVAIAACGSDSPSATTSSTSSTGASAPTPTETVTLLTHDSFAVSDSVLAAFEASTGIHVEVQRGQDAGALVNQAILTKDNPQGDVLYGVDNTLIGKATAAGLFEAYDSPADADIPAALQLDATGHTVTSVDYSDVCINLDKRAFDTAGRPAAPATLDDLTKPEYKGQLVVENPATSSPGLAFLLATVQRYGEAGYLDYWAKLKANDVKVVDGWTSAYEDTFTAGGGSGDRPLVVSYATSPPADVYYASPAKSSSDVGVLTDGCYRQVEGAGILSGTKHRAAAQKVVDFLAGAEVQADVPLQMFVFPVRTGTPLPDVFTTYAVTVGDPLQLPAAEVAAKRDGWVADWTSAVLR